MSVPIHIGTIGVFIGSSRFFGGSLSSLSVLTYSFFLQLVTFLYFISTVLRLCVCDMFLFRFLCFHLTDRPPSCIASLPFIDMVIIINAFLFLGNFVWGLDFFPLLPFVIIVGKNSSVVSCSHKSLNVHIIPRAFHRSWSRTYLLSACIKLPLLHT